MSNYRALVLATLALAFVVVVVGAYVRLSDAGLGCPDWPLCYGQPVPVQMPDDLAHAKAWTEMGHRYLAAALGLLILFVFFMSLKKRRSRLLAAALVLLGVLPPMDFANAFHVLRELGHTGEGELLPREALTAIHWAHRAFALVLVAVAGWAALKASGIAALRPLAALTGILLLLQFSLGVANVALGLPLALAAAHNAGAALLLISLVVLNFFAFRGLRPFR